MKTRPLSASILPLPTLVVVLAVAMGSTGPLAAQNTPPAPVPDAAAAPPADGTAADGTAAVSPDGEAPLDPVTPDQLKRYGLDRYEKIIEKSPFAFKIVVATPPPPISFAADLALAGFTVDSGKGITYASIVDKKTNKRFVIRTDQPNADGIQLVQLNRAPTLLESSVMARKGSEEAQIKSDKQIIERKAVVNAAVGGQPVQAMGPGGRPGPGNNVNLNLPGNRAGNVQNQINNQLQQPPQPGGQPGQQPAALPPGAVQGGTTPATAGDLSVQGAQPQAQPQGRPGQGPGRRRVILPPAPQN
jgi:hypothetical protein